MSSTVLYAEVSAVCILFLLIISIKASKSVFLQSQKRGFLLVSVTNMLLFALDAVWIFVDSSLLPVSVAGNWLLNGTYYALSGLIGYFCFRFSETIQKSRFALNKHYSIAALLPALALIVLTVLSYKNNLLFYIDSSNTYHRGPAYSVQLILAYGYVLFTAAKAFILSLKEEDYRRKKELAALSTFVIPTVISGAVQVIFPRCPILCVGTTAGILYIYLTLQEQMVSVDALTQLNNRGQMFQFLSSKLRHISETRSLYLFMIDVNKFKMINDRYGHTEGDRALTLVADSLKKACNQKGFFISRYGGDEFIVIYEADGASFPTDICIRINKTLEEVDVSYPLTVSIGFAKYSEAFKTPQEFITAADKELYKSKAQLLIRKSL